MENKQWPKYFISQDFNNSLREIKTRESDATHDGYKYNIAKKAF